MFDSLIPQLKQFLIWDLAAYLGFTVTIFSFPQ